MQNCRSQQHTLALVNMSLQMIENRVFPHPFRHEYILRFRNRTDFVGPLSEGAIAFSAAGSVLRPPAAPASSSVFKVRSGARFFAAIDPPERQIMAQPAGRAAPGRTPLDELEFGDTVMAANILSAKRVMQRNVPIALQGATGIVPQARLNPLENAERDALIHELENHGWNISTLAKQLKRSRNTPYRKMRRLGISDPEKAELH